MVLPNNSLITSTDYPASSGFHSGQSAPYKLPTIRPRVYGQAGSKRSLHPGPDSAMKEYAKKNNWNVIDHFVDEGESARTANRPELKKLIQVCKEKKNIDMVIVHKIDRLARNLEDFAMIKAILKQKGIRLISVSEPFDDNPVGRLLENIIASISEWYSANLGEEVKKGIKAKLNKGEWPQRPPLGYRSVKDQEKAG